MEKKKKVNVSTILLIISIVVIIIMGSCLYIIYSQRNENDDTIKEETSFENIKEEKKHIIFEEYLGTWEDEYDGSQIIIKRVYDKILFDVSIFRIGRYENLIGEIKTDTLATFNTNDTNKGEVWKGVYGTLTFEEDKVILEVTESECENVHRGLKIECVKKIEDNYSEIETEYYKTESYLYKHLKNGIKIEMLLPENESLKITNMEMDSTGNIIMTGDVYEEYILTKAELENVKKGETIELNGIEYKYDYKKGKKYVETEDTEIEYEIEQLIPIKGGIGVFRIEGLEDYEEVVRLTYAETKDLVDYVASQDMGIFSDLLKTDRTMTVKVNKDVRGYTINWVSEYYIDNSNSEEIDVFWDMESMEYYYNSFKENDFLPIEHFNFIVKDGEIIEYWLIRSDYMAT